MDSHDNHQHNFHQERVAQCGTVDIIRGRGGRKGRGRGGRAEGGEGRKGKVEGQSVE